MSGDVVATIKESIWIAGLIGLLLSVLNAYFGGGWGSRWVGWTFWLTRTRQLNSLGMQRAWLKHLHDTGGISGWLLSGILWVLFLFGVQLMLEAAVASQLPRSSPPVQALLRELLNFARYSVGFITMLVSINRLKWYGRLERYDTVMAWMDRAIAKLERSPEDVYYRLNLYPFVGDDVRAQAIVETVMRLPAKVREFVYAECRFLWGDDWGRCWPGDRLAVTWVITLRHDLPPEERPGVIAHEIAHAYLQHDAFHAPPDCEVEAATLARSWGFSGRGADVEWQRQRQQLQQQLQPSQRRKRIGPSGLAR